MERRAAEDQAAAFEIGAGAVKASWPSNASAARLEGVRPILVALLRPLRKRRLARRGTQLARIMRFGIHRRIRGEREIHVRSRIRVRGHSTGIDMKWLHKSLPAFNRSIRYVAAACVIVAFAMYVGGTQLSTAVQEYAAPVALTIAGVAIVLQACISPLSTFKDESLGEDELEGVELANRSIIIRLRRRSKRLRNSSNFTLVLILSAILVGLSVFIFAGRIATDESSFRQFDLLANEINYRLMSSVREAFNQAGLLRDGSPVLPSSGVDPEKLSDAMKSVKDSLMDYQGMLANKANELIDGLKGLGNSPSYQQIVSAITTRCGAAILLIFLVQILVPVYRYTTRMSAFYSARADAIQLSSRDSRLIVPDLIAALSPENIEFGKAPALPVEQLVKLMRDERAK